MIMTDSKEVAVQHPQNTSLADNMSISQMKTQVQLIQKAMSEVMQDKQHYGVVQGCGNKKVLLKPGAEKLSLLFRLSPHFEEKYGGKIIVTDLPGGHKSFEVHCAIVHIPTGDVFAIGVAMCTTMETKYRYRNGNPICPYCEKETVFRSKKQGEGFFCWKQKGGCGATFPANDEQITSQKTGRREHDNPADYYNTCIKIGKKRAYVDGIVSATACGDIFTQDLDRRDEDENGDDFPDYTGAGADQTPPKGAGNGKEKLLSDAESIIKGSEKHVSEWAIGTGKIKAGQTWKDLDESALLTITKSGPGFIKMVSNWIDSKNSGK
jgi:hypothetical protein